MWRPRRWSRLESASSECERRWEKPSAPPARLRPARPLPPGPKRSSNCRCAKPYSLAITTSVLSTCSSAWSRGEGEGVGAQVLVSLGADLSRVRHQVIQLLSGDRSPEAAGAVGVSSTEPRAGPRCPACRVRLDGHVGYRVLPVPPVDEGGASEPIDVVFVHCLVCGVVIAHIPAGEIGERMVPRLVTRSSAPLPRARAEPPSTETGVAAPVSRRATPEEAALGAFAPEDGAQVVGVRYDHPEHAVVQVGFPSKSTYYFLSLFLHDDGWSIEAPAAPDRILAEGVTADGVRWALKAGGNDESYSTVLRTEDAAGVIDCGGMGGPKLWAPQRLNVYTGGNPGRAPGRGRPLRPLDRASCAGPRARS